MNKIIYEDYLKINNEEIKKLKENYKIFEVNRLDKNLINNIMFNDEYFIKYPYKKNIINDMLNFYINNKDFKIYEKTDYLCNQKEKICICNINADNLRKIYDDNNYKEIKYISLLR